MKPFAFSAKMSKTNGMQKNTIKAFLAASLVPPPKLALSPNEHPKTSRTLEVSRFWEYSKSWFDFSTQRCNESISIIASTWLPLSIGTHIPLPQPWPTLDILKLLVEFFSYFVRKRIPPEWQFETNSGVSSSLICRDLHFNEATEKAQSHA